MAWMVAHTELLLDNAGQNRRGPDSGVQTVSHRAAFDNIVELLALRVRQFTGPSATVAFLNSLLAVLVPVAPPGMNARAMHVEQFGNLRRGVSLRAEQERLQAQRDAGSLVGLGLLAQGQARAARPRVGLSKDGLQSTTCCITNARTLRQKRPSIKEKRAKGHLSEQSKNSGPPENPLRTGRS
jgi:hypothetical protein